MIRNNQVIQGTKYDSYCTNVTIIQTTREPHYVIQTKSHYSLIVIKHGQRQKNSRSVKLMNDCFIKSVSTLINPIAMNLAYFINDKLSCTFFDEASGKF